MGTGLSDKNLDEIGNTVSAAFGGLKIATMMRCSRRDDASAAIGVVMGQRTGRNQNQHRKKQDRPICTQVELPVHLA